MMGALTEDHLRYLLTESGEMRRWREAERETPGGFEVFYPPPGVAPGDGPSVAYL
jgi:hypothetical protein